MIVRDFILKERSDRVKQLALQAGFDACGISEAAFLEVQAPRLESWLNNNHQGAMGWMENHFDKRLDPRLLVEDTRSVVSVLLNYYPEKRLNEGEGTLKISKYAYGADYHDVLKSKLKELMELLKEEFGEIHGRAFVDSAPVMDKVWAEKSGLGWIGKNSNLINKGSGSFYFIGELLIDLELAGDNSTSDYCGTCTRCIDACPTDAIIAPYIVDGSKCISYYTIELKEAIPQEAKGKMENWIFGCDVCQDVCPWNRFATPAQNPEFKPSEKLLGFTNADWQDITEEVFSELFRKSAIKRTKFSGLKRNITFNSES